MILVELMAQVEHVLLFIEHLVLVCKISAESTGHILLEQFSYLKRNELIDVFKEIAGHLKLSAHNLDHVEYQLVVIRCFYRELY